MPEYTSSEYTNPADGRQQPELPLPVEETPPMAEPVAGESARQQRWRKRHILLATLTAFGLLLVLFTVTGQIDSLAQNFLNQFRAKPSTGTDVIAEAVAEEETGIFTFQGLDIHPDVLFQPYTAGAVLGNEGGDGELIRQFRELIGLYQQRQGEDDNFTIRVVDNRTNDLLELFTLEGERDKYRQTGRVHWHSIDVLRRQQTRRLVDKYAAQGIPREAVTVKWGRADQVLEARANEASTIEYEIRLARYLGLSLLPTEIGTVETFNQDRLVSSVGARSRYQMMPAVLRENGIRSYDLRTASGNVISVTEEWHPLLTMESSFRTLSGYVRAVGHELPGISAYHTGPANIYKVYQNYLIHNASKLSPSTTVMDAYMWAVTEGFPIASRGTSFGDYSRGYVASLYGSLKAVEDEPVDTSKTMLAERVQIQEGKQIFLSQLLRTLETNRSHLSVDDYGDASMYRIFREMNPHMALPEATDSSSVPVRGDVTLTAHSGGADVRFFLPLGSSYVLSEAGADILDPSAMFTFDHSTYLDPRYGAKTMWDRQYDALVQDIGRFGFTPENRSRLFSLQDRFEQMAKEDPSHYRQTQLEVINIHQNIWQYGQWSDVASTVSSAQGKLRPTPEPPTPLPATPRS